MRTPLDEFDIKILNLVQSDNRMSVEQMAKEVCLSPSTIQRRLRRLRREGVIEADISVVAPEVVGRKLIAIVEVVLERENSESVETFKRSMKRAPEVTQCYYVTGEADFVLIMTVEDMQTYEEIARRLFTANPNVKRFKTSIVVSRVKFGLMIPL